MSERHIDGFWATWVDGQEWPSWYYGETMAREAAARLALSHPGRRIFVCYLVVDEIVTLPGELKREVQRNQRTTTLDEQETQ